MYYETVCRNCGHIVKEFVPILNDKNGMDMLCSRCDMEIITFYNDTHPIAVYMKGALRK